MDTVGLVDQEFPGVELEQGGDHPILEIGQPPRGIDPDVLDEHQLGAQFGLVGAVLVALSAQGLLKETAKVLLDREMDHPVVDEIREVIAEQGAASATVSVTISSSS